MSLLDSGTAQPCPGAVPAHYTSRLLAFLPSRSFPGHPGRERNRWVPPLPTKATVVPGGAPKQAHETPMKGERETRPRCQGAQGSSWCVCCLRKVGSGCESTAVNPQRCHKWHWIKSPASFHAVDTGTEGRNMRRVNQRGLCFLFFGSEPCTGVGRIRSEYRETGESWEPGSRPGTRMDRQAEGDKWVSWAEAGNGLHQGPHQGRGSPITRVGCQRGAVEP